MKYLLALLLLIIGIVPAMAITTIPLGTGLTAVQGSANTTPYTGNNQKGIFPQAFPNTYTGTHNVTASESAGVDICNKSSAMTMNLPQAGTTGFLAGTTYSFLNINTGTCTISTTTSTLNGMPLTSSNIALPQYGFASCVSDGTNWNCSGLGAYQTPITFPTSGDVLLSGGASSNPTGIAEVDGDCLLGSSGAWVAGSCSGSSAFTLTTIGTSGASTYIGGVLNIPQYTGGGGSGVNPILLPSSVYTTDTGGNLFPYVYAGGGGNAAVHDVGWGVAASLAASPVLELRFQMPPSIPSSGTFKLKSYCLANATSGTAKYTPSDGMVAAGASPSAVTLTGDTQVSQTWANADYYYVNTTTLSATPLADNVSVVAVTFNTSGWTLASIMSCRWEETWE